MFQKSLDSGWREVYFGNVLRGSPHIARFIEFFVKRQSTHSNSSGQAFDSRFPETAQDFRLIRVSNAPSTSSLSPSVWPKSSPPFLFSNLLVSRRLDQCGMARNSLGFTLEEIPEDGLDRSDQGAEDLAPLGLLPNLRGGDFPEQTSALIDPEPRGSGPGRGGRIAVRTVSGNSNTEDGLPEELRREDALAKRYKIENASRGGRDADDEEWRKLKDGSQELWLVFHDEGMSLHSFIYTVTGSILGPSPFWKMLHTDPAGPNVYRNILHQLLQGAATLHAQDITHRDIKPSNILVDHTSRPVVVRLADLGSAVQPDMIRILYDKAPSTAEETIDYAPPEAKLGDDLPFSHTHPHAYDVWSLAVVFLELHLATPPADIFTLSAKEYAKFSHRNKDLPPKARTQAALFYAFKKFCIAPEASTQVPPRASGIDSSHDQTTFERGGDIECSTEGGAFAVFRKRLGELEAQSRGRHGHIVALGDYGYELLFRMMQFTPEGRITATEALAHAFFRGGFECSGTSRVYDSEPARQTKCRQAAQMLPGG
eukprot:c16784_g1_i4.p1 GENE.c16784_g1_i4~~c16784_g1_i4.p1  ORF type:complete len:540 (-),score=115.92 c16784_g1_i4:33-1652(-)